MAETWHSSQHRSPKELSSRAAAAKTSEASSGLSGGRRRRRPAGRLAWQPIHCRRCLAVQWW